jgi:hypothetical protein
VIIGIHRINDNPEASGLTMLEAPKTKKSVSFIGIEEAPSTEACSDKKLNDR